MIYAKLDDDTCVCMDVWNNGEHNHHDGPIDESSVSWRYFKLIPWPRPGEVPRCTVEARPADIIDDAVTPWLGAIEHTEPEWPHDDFWEWSRQFEPSSDEMAIVQWKGTDACYTFTCSCGSSMRVRGEWFAFAVMCSKCRAVFHAVPALEAAP